MNKEQIISNVKKSFKSTFPEVTVKKIADLDSNYFLVCASDKEEDFNSPFYAVSKKDYKIYSYNPIQDIDNFSEATEKRVIYGGE